MKKQHNYQKRLCKPTEMNLVKRLSGTGLRRPNPDVVPIGVSPMARFSNKVISVSMGYGEAVNACGFDPHIRWFEPTYPSHKSDLQFSPLA